MTSTDSSNYPRNKKTDGSHSNEYPKAAPITTTKSLKSTRNLRRNFRSFLKAIIFIEILAICGLISAMYVVIMRSVMKSKLILTQEKTPVYSYFDEFAVSSSSEHCSELASTMYVEEYPMNLIAAALQYCLHLQRPDRSGELGSSVAVNYRSSTKHCRYTRGESRPPNNKTLIETFVNLSSSYVDSFLRGPYSELVPLDLVTTLGFLENSSQSDIEEVALFMKSDHGDKCIALTIDEVDPLEIGFLISHDLLFSNESELMRREKGEVVKITDFDDRMRRFASLTELKNSTKLEHYIKNRIQSQHNRKVPPFSTDFSQLRHIRGKYWETNEMVEDPHDMKYCIPGKNSLGPLIFSTLKGTEYNVTEEYYETTTKDIFSKLIMLVSDLYKTVNESHIPSAWNKFDSFTYYIPEPQRPLNANMFVIATHEEAYAYIGSIGSAFGSLNEVPFMNNLMAGVVENFRVDRGFTNSMTPFIAVKDDKIAIAYSGSPGFTSTSLGIPRMLQTLIMHNIYGILLEKSVLCPLAFESPVARGLLYLYSFPKTILYDYSGAVMYAPSHYEDSVAALSRRIEDNRSVLVPFYKTKSDALWEYSNIIGI